MKKIYVRFHVGRGGRFWNQGHMSFVNEDNFQDLIRACGDKLFDTKEIWDEETGEEIPLDESEWNYHDAGGKILVKGREAMEADTGILDWDGLYDTENAFQCGGLGLIVFSIGGLHSSRGTNCTPPQIQFRVSGAHTFDILFNISAVCQDLHNIRN